MADAMDWEILRELQADARLSYNELSRRLHLSPPAVAERIRRLEESGVISGHHTHVDAAAAGWSITAFIRLSCYGPRCVLRDPDVQSWPEIQEIHRVTGDVCSILKVVAESMETFEALIDRLGVYGRPSSSMVLSTPLKRRPIGAGGSAASGSPAESAGDAAAT